MQSAKGEAGQDSSSWYIPGKYYAHYALSSGLSWPCAIFIPSKKKIKLSLLTP